MTTEQKCLVPERSNIQTAADNQFICCCWYLRRPKRIKYKVLSETGEKEEKVFGEPGEVEDVEVSKTSNLLRSIGIAGDISDGLD